MKRYPIYLVTVKGNRKAAENAAASRGIPSVFIEENFNALYSKLAVTADHQERILRWAAEPALMFHDRGYAEGTCIHFEKPGEVAA